MRVLPNLKSMATVVCAVALLSSAAEARPHRPAAAARSSAAATRHAAAAKSDAHAGRAARHGAAVEAKSRTKLTKADKRAAATPNRPLTRAERRAAAREEKLAASEAKSAPVRRDRHGRVIEVAKPSGKKLTRAERRAAAREEKLAAKQAKAGGKRGRRQVEDEAAPLPSMKRVKTHAAEPETLPQPVARAEQPAAEPSAPPAPMPVTHHDRKTHHDVPQIPKADSGDPATPLTPAAVADAVPVSQASVVMMEAPDDGALPIEEALLTPASGAPALYTKGGRMMIPPPMKGSHEILVRQNQMADSDGLVRVRDDEGLNEMRAAKTLVALPQNEGIVTDNRLPGNRRYCRPWTAQFLLALAKAHYAQFHTPLQVNSAVRTVAFQQRLMRTNGNAAPAAGETASPHLTGQAVDLAKKGLSMSEVAWIRSYLLPLVQQGKIDVEEEFQQACFHISVYKRYVPSAPERRNLAGDGAKRGVGIAAALR